MTTQTLSVDELTRIINDWNNGDKAALDRVINILYEDLRKLAHGRLRNERKDRTLQATALVGEVYLRLTNHNFERVNYEDRREFIRLASWLMRNILVDNARKRKLEREKKVHLPEDMFQGLAKMERVSPHQMLELDRALDRLDELKPELSRIAHNRLFLGYSHKESARVLGLNEDQVRKRWRGARSFLENLISRK